MPFMIDVIKICYDLIFDYEKSFSILRNSINLKLRYKNLHSPTRKKHDIKLHGIFSGRARRMGNTDQKGTVSFRNNHEKVPN